MNILQQFLLSSVFCCFWFLAKHLVFKCIRFWCGRHGRINDPRVLGLKASAAPPNSFPYLQIRLLTSDIFLHSFQHIISPPLKSRGHSLFHIPDFVKPIYGANLDTSMLEHFYQIWAKIFGAVLGPPCLGLFGVYGHVNVNRLVVEHTF